MKYFIVMIVQSDKQWSQRSTPLEFLKNYCLTFFTIIERGGWNGGPRRCPPGIFKK